MAGAFAFLLFVFFVGATGDDKPTGPETTAAAADSRETPRATPTAKATPTGTPAAEPAPASSPEPPPPQAAPPTSDQIIAQAQPSTALALLATLEVKGRAPKTGYDRALFGQAWADTDRNGCGTRDDMLKRDLTGETFKAGTGDCVVLTGQLADPYTGQTLSFTKADAGAIQIDHLVALSDAWQKGAQQWDAGKRLAFANDPLNLLAVDGPTNASKSDGDAATWLPPNKGYRCAMVARQTAVKAKYALWVTAAEREAIARVLSVCPNEPAPTGGSPTTAAVPAQATSGAPQPAASPAPVAAAPEAPAPAARRFANCTEMRTVYPQGVGMPGAVDSVSGGVGTRAAALKRCSFGVQPSPRQPLGEQVVQQAAHRTAARVQHGRRVPVARRSAAASNRMTVTSDVCRVPVSIRATVQTGTRAASETLH